MADIVAHEPADPPPDPQWLVDAIWEGHSDRGNEGWYADGTTVAERVIRAALPILRAGIEQELRERLAGEVASMVDGLSTSLAGTIRGGDGA